MTPLPWRLTSIASYRTLDQISNLAFNVNNFSARAYLFPNILRCHVIVIQVAIDRIMRKALMVIRKVGLRVIRLSDDNVTSEDVWEQVKDVIEYDVDGFLVFDDSVSDKNRTYAKETLYSAEECRFAL